MCIRDRLLDEVVDSKIDMGEFLEKVYQNLVLEPYAVDRYAKFFDELLHQDDGAVLYLSLIHILQVLAF